MAKATAKQAQHFNAKQAPRYVDTLILRYKDTQYKYKSSECVLSDTVLHRYCTASAPVVVKIKQVGRTNLHLLMKLVSKSRN